MVHFALDDKKPPWFIYCLGITVVPVEAKGDAMKASDPQLRVRLDPDALEWLRRAAEANCRSMNGEINYLLRAAMAGEANQSPADAGGATAAGQASQA